MSSPLPAVSPPQPARKKWRAGAGLAVAGLALLTLLGFLGRWWWAFDLTAHFRVQYAAALGLIGLVLLLWRQYRAAAAAGTFLLVNVALIAPLYFPAPATPTGPTTRAVQLNLHVNNGSHVVVLQLLRELKPDLVMLEEVTPQWLEALRPLREDLPFVAGDAEVDPMGAVLFSRFPLETAEVRTFAVAHTPFLVARVIIRETPVTVIGAHLFPPIGPELSAWRDAGLAQLAEVVAETPGPTLLLGDLNVSPWSPIFADLLQRSGLRDSERGFGVQPTWRRGFWPLAVPIDHALVSPEIVVHNRFVGPDVGSDHRPLVVDFSVVER